MVGAAVAILVGSLLGGHGGAGQFPHSGDPCKDACDMTKLACEKDCADKAKKRDPTAKQCAVDCKDEVARCQVGCPALYKQAEQKMKDKKAGKAVTPPVSKGQTPP